MALKILQKHEKNSYSKKKKAKKFHTKRRKEKQRIEKEHDQIKEKNNEIEGEDEFIFAETKQYSCEENQLEKKNQEDNFLKYQFDATFDFVDPNENHIEYLKILAVQTQLFKKNCIDIDKICKCAANQGNIGVVVVTSKIIDEEEKEKEEKNVFNDVEDTTVAFLSILNFSQYENCLNSLKDFFINAAKKFAAPNIAQKFQKIMEENLNTVGIMFNFRYVNSPPTLAKHLHQILIDDIAWSTQRDNLDIPEEEKAFYFFSHIVLYTRIFLDKNNILPESQIDEKFTLDEILTSLDKGALVMNNFEEAEYVRYANLAFGWNVNKVVHLSTSISLSNHKSLDENHNDKVKPFCEYRMVCVVPYNKLEKIVQNISKIETFEKQKQIHNFF